MEKIIQITAGRGPAECCWVVAQVLKYCIEDIKHNGLTYKILHREQGVENGTVQSVTLQIQGNMATSFVTTWLGTIQWVGTSTFRKYHKRKNWFIGVYEIPTIQLKNCTEKDMTFQTMRSSGPGGQNVNKVNSAVRAIHRPTGVYVVVMDSRSQHQNKKTAIERLKDKVNEVQIKDLKQELSQQWENHLNVQRGNPIRVFKGADFKKKSKNKSFKNKRNQLKKDLRKEL